MKSRLSKMATMAMASNTCRSLASFLILKRNFKYIMEWVLRSPQLHSTFGNLGFAHSDGYHINENCDAVLESILHNILVEDKYLRTYRRSIKFGQNIEKDLIPLSIHAKEEKTLKLLISILVNLTIPIEGLLSVDIISKTDFGKLIIFDINSLLASTKLAYTDQRATKVIIEYLKKNLELEPQTKLSTEQCANISESLLLLRNILHIPAETCAIKPGHSGTAHPIQNQILWNLFTQGIDKILIKLMTISQAHNWSVIMVQLIALLYKDQHVVTLHKLLNIWLDASLSESSEDNESNTSPPNRGSEDSSPLLTSDPTSDSSDTNASGKSNDEPNAKNNRWGVSSENNNDNEVFQSPQAKESEAKIKMNNNKKEETTSCSSSSQSGSNNFPSSQTKNKLIKHKSETSDYGYGTQLENQESVSNTSNEDEMPEKKPLHQKPHNPKQRINPKSRSANLQERKRKKIVKRTKVNVINVQGLSHKTPTDDDISDVLKEFTVNFLLKGYNSLVQTLHNQMLTNRELEIDTSHFFWLVTYFLKFATQIELDFEHVSSILSFDIVSYLTAEGVNLCEQFELAVKNHGSDLNSNIRRQHLLVTAIREYVQTVEIYKKLPHICDENKKTLAQIERKMCETEEFRSIFVLFLRHYNPKYHSKQYLQDLVVTNHILLSFLDCVMKSPGYEVPYCMTDHIKQFATSLVMKQYGLLLEDYANNGEFVNDCIFTMMHHVAGDLGSVISLFQPRILRVFTSIWKSEYVNCDDWSDLIEYVINTFIKKPYTLYGTGYLQPERFDDMLLNKPSPPTLAESVSVHSASSPHLFRLPQSPIQKTFSKESSICDTLFSEQRWTEDELSSLSWNYLQCSTKQDIVAEVVKLLQEDGITKSRDSVIAELFKQNIISKDEHEAFVEGESARNSKSTSTSEEMIDAEIAKLCEELKNDGKSRYLHWVQKVLLETCYAKIYQERSQCGSLMGQNGSNILNYEFLKKTLHPPITSPISYHAVLQNRSVPLVPLNCEQEAICQEPNFVQLLNKLGFHLSLDTGKLFVRIPNFWSTSLLFKVASKIAPVDPTTLKFSVDNLSDKIIASTNDDVSTLVSTPKYLTTENNYIPTVDKMAQAVVGAEVRCTSDTPSKPAAPRSLLAPFTGARINAPAAPLSESEDSMCEATFVASDLTRMYVSDEDEEDVARVAAGSASGDSDGGNTGKRQRLK